MGRLSEAINYDPKKFNDGRLAYLSHATIMKARKGKQNGSAKKIRKS